jgi:uncharacterized membrane protein YdjX (TVP38/TMEM64 family)
MIDSSQLTQLLVDFLRRWGELSPTSAAVLALVFIAGGLVPVPRTFLTLAAGVVFGMAAIPIIIPSTTAGCLIAFLFARYLFAPGLWRWVARRPKLLAVTNAVDAEGWRIVALCRLASPIPSTIQNALFGLTRIAIWPYAWATLIFTIPQIVLYTYLGAIGKAALLGESKGVNLGVMIAGGLTFLAVVLMITRRVRASMRDLARCADAAAKTGPVS